MAFITTAKQTNPKAWSIKEAMQSFFKEIDSDISVRIDKSAKGIFVEAMRFGEEIAICNKVENNFATFKYNGANIHLPL